MHDPREASQSTWSPSSYAEPGVGQEQVFIPSSHVRVVGDESRAEMIRETYRLLAIAAFAAMVTCWVCSRSIEVVSFMASPLGWIVAMIGLNMVPGMAMRAARENPRNGALMLAYQGAVSGLALSPLVFVAMLKSGVGDDAPNLVQAALLITAGIFLGISGYVYQSGREFKAGRGFIAGLTWMLMIAIPLNIYWLHMGGLGLFILCAVGLIGIWQLVYGTSAVLRDPDFRSPVAGAFILWAGLFNVFQFVLSMLVRSRR